MKKSLLSAVGLAFALAVSMPVLGPNSAAAATKPAPAATTKTTSAPASDAMTKKKPKKHVTKACKVTKKHKCPVKHHRKHATKTAAPKTAY